MLTKMEAKGLKSVTDFRIVKQHINNAVRANKVATISRRLEEFARDAELTPDHLNISSATIVAEAKKVVRAAENLYSQVGSIDVEEFYGEELMWEKLESLSRLIREKLRAVGRRE
jgi:hypothetical protein